MFSRIFALTAIAAFALVGTQAHHHHQVKGDVMEDTKQLIEQLKQLIQKEVVAAKLKIDEIDTKITQMAVHQMEEGKQQIQDKYAEFLNRLQLLKALLGEAGEPCFETAQPAIEGLANEMTNGFEACVVVLVQDAWDFLYNIVTDTEGVSKIVTRLEKDLSQCSDWNIPCIMTVAWEAERQLESIPVEITEQVQKAENLIAIIETDMQNCAVNQLEQMGDKMAEIEGNLIDCADDAAAKPIAH